MLFNSLPFFIFFPIVSAIYFLLRKQMSRIYWLLAASIFFYGYFIPKYLLVLFALILVDYLAGLLLNKILKQEIRKFLLILSIVSNLAILFFFKYLGFFTGISFLDMVLPIGLSFHTFQSMSYVIEVYCSRYTAEKNLFVYALYVMYFPQLVAGPIERPQNLIHQLKVLKEFSYSSAVNGLKLMVIGMYMKVVLADNIAPMVDIVYKHHQNLNGESVLYGVLLFGIQIFCDFAGYSLIAIGASKILGINLSENFNMPYNSTSLTDFWRRWHISLTTWFRDYIFIPLGGNRVSKVKYFRNILIVFLLSGLWHGAAWTFVIWGALNGLTLIFENLFKVKIIPNLLRKTYTFILVSLLWVFFRAENLNSALEIIGKIFNLNNYSFDFLKFQEFLTQTKAETSTLIIILFSILITFSIYNLKNSDVYNYIESQKSIYKYLFYLLLCLTILIYGKNNIDGSPFIYFQF
jgi:alginate O-acetyltransferase complex protein AlgI